MSIRKALNTAVDRQKIVDGVLNGYGTVSTTGLEQMPWENKDAELSKDEYANVDEAKKILADGGWKDSDNDGIVEKDGQKAEFKLLLRHQLFYQLSFRLFGRHQHRLFVLLNKLHLYLKIPLLIV